MILMLVLYISVGLLMCGLSLPLIWHKVPPNNLYGFRVRQTLESDPLSTNTWSRPVGRRSWECPCGGNRMLRILSSPATIPAESTAIIPEPKP